MNDAARRLHEAVKKPASMWILLAEAGQLLKDGKQLPGEWACHIGKALIAASKEAEEKSPQSSERAGTLLAKKLGCTRSSGRPNSITAEEINEFIPVSGLSASSNEFPKLDDVTGLRLEDPTSPSTQENAAAGLQVDPKTVRKTIAAREKEIADNPENFFVIAEVKTRGNK